MSLALLLLLGCPAQEPPVVDDSAVVDDTAVATWRSELYPSDWTPDHGLPDGRFLHDFSYAGYHAGEAELPDELPEPVRSVLDAGADPTGAQDSTAAIQQVIDALPDGGTVWLPEGRYRIDGALTVSRSGVVVAGEGSERTFLHFTRDTGTTDGAGLTLRGAAPSSPGDWTLSDDGASRSATVRVSDATGLAVGDAVAVGWTITDAFRADHGMEERWGFAADAWRPFFRRTVVAVEGDVVVLDVPLRYPALVRDSASIRRDDGALVEVGVQDLAVSSAVDPAKANAADRHHALLLHRVADGWVRRVASFAPEDGGDHLQSGGLLVRDSRRVTVADVSLGPVQNRGEGGNGYLFEISRSGEVLIRDSVGRGGRHNFIQNWDFGTSGCVFLRTTSVEGRALNNGLSMVGLSEFHHALAMANLIDHSVADDGWQSKNRGAYSSGAGHAGTENVFWNVRGEGALWSMQYAMGYVVGTGPELTVHTALDTFDLTFGAIGTEPEDHREGIGEAALLEPQSLYEDQLTRRLGR